jgi:transposase InsO family protein
VIGLYKTECVRHDGPWRGVEDLKLATPSWVHRFNHHRLHSTIDHVLPVDRLSGGMTTVRLAGLNPVQLAVP